MLKSPLTYVLNNFEFVYGLLCLKRKHKSCQFLLIRPKKMIFKREKKSCSPKTRKAQSAFVWIGALGDNTEHMSKKSSKFIVALSLAEENTRQSWGPNGFETNSGNSWTIMSFGTLSSSMLASIRSSFMSRNRSKHLWRMLTIKIIVTITGL